MAIDMDYDLDRWVYVPNVFPWESFADEEQWADAVARAFGGEGRTAAPAELVDWLRAYLVGAVRNNRSGTIRFVHLPHITAPHAIVDVYDLPRREDVALTDLTHENQGPAVREPDVVPFASETLGTGTKSTRWIRTAGDTIVRATNWVWRTPERDIVVLTAGSDLPLAEALDPVVDELARSIRLA